MPTTPGLLARLSADLHQARQGPIAASAQGSGFGGYFFTRDALEIAMDLVTYDRFLSRDILLTVPQWQGAKHDPVTEEQPGRPAHQVFREVVDGRYARYDRIEDARAWAGRWGVPYREGFTVYNSTDGAPLYIMAVDRYVRQWGTALLGDRYVHSATGETRSVAEATARHADWIHASIEKSDRGLPETPSTNPLQTSWSAVMRDGNDSYFHPLGPHGLAVNRGGPIAYVEVVGLAHAALTAASRLLPTHEHATRWAKTAALLPERLIENFWMEDRQFFAAALDSDAAGQRRQVRLESSAAFELLRTDILRSVPEGPDIVRALTLAQFSPAWMTEVGPSMLNGTYPFEGRYCAYQGAHAAWAVTDGILAEGLANFGLGPLAHDLGVERLLGGLGRSGSLEHWYLDPASRRPVYHPYLTADAFATEQAKTLPTAALGQLGQAWSASKGIRMALHVEQGGFAEPAPGSWEAKLCRDALSQVADIPPATAGRPAAALVCDPEEGRQLGDQLLLARTSAAVCTPVRGGPPGPGGTLRSRPPGGGLRPSSGTTAR